MLDIVVNPKVIGVICSCVVILMLIGSCLYSPSQYRKLKRLYKEQCEADDKVYELKPHMSLVDKLLFRFTTKDVEHYYG